MVQAMLPSTIIVSVKNVVDVITRAGVQNYEQSDRQGGVGSDKRLSREAKGR